MYEDNKFKLNINWKSLIIKLAILLLVVFIICLIIFRPKKENNFISLATNITAVKEVAIEYFKNNMVLEEIGDYEKVTLSKLIANDYIEKQVDSEGNTCSIKRSYAYLTKIRDDEFVLKINMYCGEVEEAKTYNLTTKDLTIVASKEEEIIEPEIDEEILVEEEVAPEEPKIEEVIEEDKPIADNTQPPKKENNTTHIDFGNDELIEELHNPNSNKKVYYKHVSYGEWTEGNKYGFNIETATKTINYYNYCYNGNCIVDREENTNNYIGYSKSYSYSKNVPVYRYVYTVWSTSTCIKGLTNTGITEYR